MMLNQHRFLVKAAWVLSLPQYRMDQPASTIRRVITIDVKRET